MAAVAGHDPLEADARAPHRAPAVGTHPAPAAVQGTSASLLSLQALAGNAAVQRLLAPGRSDGESVDVPANGTRHEVSVDQHHIEVTIPKAPARPRAAAARPASAARPDSPPGQEEEAAAAVAAAPKEAEPAETGASESSATPEANANEAASGATSTQTAETGAAPESAEAGATAPTTEEAPPIPGAGPAPEGEAPEQAGAGPTTGSSPIKLPDFEVPELAEIGKSDAVYASLGYSGSTTRGGAQPTGFGVTRSFGCTVTNVWVVPLPWAYAVRATVTHPVTYQIRSGTGPDGQANIASENDGAITAANYASVASDLTPNMGDLNGRPPRDAFWSEDLTSRHELVHCADDRANAPGVVTQIANWLSGQSAASAADVQTLLGQVPTRFASGLLAALTTEAGEQHAYGDGAPSYLARANAITAKGGRGEYP